ncbi:MAG: TolC family protein [Silvibacterium sp.]
MTRLLRNIFLATLIVPAAAFAQSELAAATLPSAPAPGLVAQAADTAQASALSRAEAERLAILHNPRISVGRLLALAQHQVVREARSANLPLAMGSITASQAEDGSRVSAGSLTAPRLFTHAGAGGSVSQLITDFGRTHNLVASQKLEEKAQNANALAATEDIVLATDQAFYNALQAQALLKVAAQTVETRQTTETLVNQMTQNKLKSTLDLSFAEVDLSQARLLQLDAQNNADATMAALDAILGLDHTVRYDLVQDVSPLLPPPADADPLVQTALGQRPDLESLAYGQQSAQKFARAQRDQLLPTISALGVAGSVPIRPAAYYTNNWWGSIGVNMNVPIFNGFLYSAQAKEAEIRAEAASEQTRELRDEIVRDVRTAWLAANTAYQRVSVTGELVKQANLAMQLAQTRYKLGLSSIVELSQAQLQQTEAEITNTNASYQYRLASATLAYETGAQP